MTDLETLHQKYQRGACEGCKIELPLRHSLYGPGLEHITTLGACMRGQYGGSCTALDFPTWADQHVAALTERAERAERDTARLDWLENRRLALNAHYGTQYGWKFVASHNVTRLFVRDLQTIDINDAQARGGDIRAAIDAALVARQRAEAE